MYTLNVKYEGFHCLWFYFFPTINSRWCEICRIGLYNIHIAVRSECMIVS